MAAEFWVMRIVYTAEELRRAPPTERVARLIDAGDLHLIGGDICEPIAEVRSQELATARMLELAARTGKAYKVVMSADPGDLVGGELG
jgi:hypothetical protein